MVVLYTLCRDGKYNEVKKEVLTLFKFFIKKMNLNTDSLVRVSGLPLNW